MNSALFVLAINMSISVIMAAAFVGLGRFDRRNVTARWFALAFALSTLSSVGEMILQAGIAVSLSRMLIALSMLGTFILIGRGLALRYRVELPWTGLLAIFIASLLLYLLILEQPREDLTRQLLYQLPYALLSLLGAYVVWRGKQRRPLDIALAILLITMAVHFATKPLIANLIGGVGGRAEDYMTTLYGLFSQATGGVLALGFAMLLLAISITDSMAAIIKHTERDTETGLLNPRGFEDHATRLLAQKSGGDMALVLFSLDAANPAPAFSAIPTGFAGMLETLFGTDALIARLGGLQFAVLLPDANLFAARAQAETLIGRLAATEPPAAPPSIGITEREPGDSLPELIARSQWACQEARRAGGNCVRLAARAALSLTRPPAA